MGSSLTQPSGISYFSPYTFFSKVRASVLILGQNSLLKFVLNYNNIFKLQYPMDLESSLYIMSALAHQKIPYPTGHGYEPHSAQWYFIFLPIHVFSEVFASVLILGQNSLLKFVSILNYNNIFKLQYPMDPESSLYIISALAHHKIPYPTGHSEKSSIILFHETCF